ncbi:MAG: 5-formyltetrahydrofolate cyclo-ligase [Acetobacteraceae bacterium]
MKQQARAAAHEARAGCDPAVGERLAGHVLSAGIVPPGAIVSGFWPMGDEIDIRPLLHALAARGHVLALPETPPLGQPLVFHRWQPGDPLRQERFGTMTADGAAITPDVLLVPMLAFDRQGRRLGYGGGYYDRTLAALPGRPAIGCAFAAQEIPAVPVGPFDISLDAIATECGVILIRT